MTEVAASPDREVLVATALSRCSALSWRCPRHWPRASACLPQSSELCRALRTECSAELSWLREPRRPQPPAQEN